VKPERRNMGTFPTKPFTQPRETRRTHPLRIAGADAANHRRRHHQREGKCQERSAGAAHAAEEARRGREARAG
jgi:hypothetical protein